jgi:hypothetical protein
MREGASRGKRQMGLPDPHNPHMRMATNYTNCVNAEASFASPMPMS